MGADGPEGIAAVTLTPCISRKEETAKIVAAVMTVGNSPDLAPYQKNRLILSPNTLLKEKTPLIAVKIEIFTCRWAQGEICSKD